MSSSAVHFIAIKMLTAVRPLTSFLPFCMNLKQQELDFKDEPSLSPDHKAAAKTPPPNFLGPIFRWRMFL